MTTAFTPQTDDRYELKITCDARLLPQARLWIRLHSAPFRIAYPTRQINNLYLDTPQFNSLIANQVGIPDREKLRIRWYGEHREGVVVNPTLELKVKRGMLGRKKQQRLDCEVDWCRPYRDILATLYEAAAEDWEPWLGSAIQPALINWYRRDYYETYDGEIRLTLDYDQAACDQRLAIRPNFSRMTPIESLIVIEIKGGADRGDRLQEIISRFPFPRRRNSKYVNGMEASWL